MRWGDWMHRRARELNPLIDRDLHVDYHGSHSTNVRDYYFVPNETYASLLPKAMG